VTACCCVWLVATGYSIGGACWLRDGSPRLVPDTCLKPEAIAAAHATAAILCLCHVSVSLLDGINTHQLDEVGLTVPSHNKHKCRHVPARGSSGGSSWMMQYSSGLL
jgi:hypothetical protein